MEALRHPILLGSVALYMVLCVLVGLWAMRRTHSVRDFFMAGRDLGIMVTGVAIFSSTMSGFGFVGGPGLVYSMGMSSVWIVITATHRLCDRRFPDRQAAAPLIAGVVRHRVATRRGRHPLRQRERPLPDRVWRSCWE